jgi:hypothetical protein
MQGQFNLWAVRLAVQAHFARHGDRREAIGIRWGSGGRFPNCWAGSFRSAWMRYLLGIPIGIRTVALIGMSVLTGVAR